METIDTDFRDRALEAIERRFQEEEAARPEKPWLQAVSNWYRNGSAGKALEWFTEILDANPGASPQAVIEKLAVRMDEEVASWSTQWYTRRHFREFLEVVRSAAASGVSR